MELLELIDQLNKDIDVDGLLVQLPLPDHIDEKTICQAVDQWKDVDGFHLNNIGEYNNLIWTNSLESYTYCMSLFYTCIH